MAVTKTFMTGLTLATLVLGGGIAYFLLNINTIAKPITERIATQTLGVPVTIESMDISLKEKRIQVGGLKIANPTGYKTPYALKTDNIDVQLESFANNLLTFKTIAINESNVNLEVTTQGTNLNDIKKGISAKSASTSSETTESSSSSTESSKADSMKVIIKNFEFSGASLNPTVTLLKEQALDPVIAPDLVLTGIGEKSNGVLAQEAIAQIAEAIFTNLNKAAGSSGFLSGMSSDALKEMGQGQIDVIKERVNEKVNELGGAVRGLFGK